MIERYMIVHNKPYYRCNRCRYEIDYEIAVTHGWNVCPVCCHTLWEENKGGW